MINRVQEIFDQGATIAIDGRHAFHRRRGRAWCRRTGKKRWMTGPSADVL